MFKKIISLILTTSVICSLGIPFNASAESAETIETAILMNGEEITETETGTNRYTYITDSLDNIPVLSCRYDVGLYDCLITQPERENAYTGVVTLISKSDQSETAHTVYVCDENAFDSHFINLGGDPWVTYHDGWYYYMVTGNGFYVSKSRDLERVNSNPVSVFDMNNLIGEEISIVKELWAPELHFIDGYWYIYFTVYDGEQEDSSAWNGCTGQPRNHRMYVLKSDTSDAQGSYTFMGQIKENEDDYINDANYDATKYKPGHYAIDQSVFKWNGELYAVWSGWDRYVSVEQRIYVAKMENPWTISSQRTELSRPEYAYETYSVVPAINEAPQALISPDGKTLNIAFSVNRFDDSTYSLGLLTLKENGDPLNAEDWNKTDKPVFETSIKNSTYSVGHCSFVPSPDGNEYYVVYHARRGEDVDSNPREVRVQQFFWNDNGTPHFPETINASTLVNKPSGTAMFNITKLEAEDAVLSGKAAVYSSYDSTATYQADYYSGGKHIVLGTSGSSATFTYNAEKDGKYTISLLASGSSSTISGFTVTVNGTEYKRKLGGNSSNLNNFYYYDIEGVDLIAGENTITVAHKGDFTRGGYLDRVDIWNEEDCTSSWDTQDSLNAVTDKNPIILKTEHKTTKLPEYNKEYTFDSFGDFDKYWYTSNPFVYDPEYPDAITTVTTDANKRLLVTGEEFRNIANFKASLEITPAAEHTLENGKTVTAEAGINTGILFRIGEMKDYTTNKCTFDGYRCFLTVSSGVVKMQLTRYYFETKTSIYASSQVLKTTTSSLSYTPGNTYNIEVTCIGNTVNARAYNTNDPDNVITIENQSIETSVANTLDSGKIGIFVNCGSRVAVDNMKVTPYSCLPDTNCDLGNLNNLSSFDLYKADTRTVSEENGVISIPTGVTKLLVNTDTAQNISNFKASSRIKITNSNAYIQTGFAFRVSDVISTPSAPGMTGYAIVLQRTSSHNANEITINLTKYGTNSSGSTNVNLGNQSYKNTTLLSDITDKAQIKGLEFDLNVTVLDNKMSVTVTRVDNPSLTVTYTWQLDDEDYKVNQNYPVYYESGRIGFFSNGVAEMSHIAINNLYEEHEITTAATNGNIILNTTKTEAGNRVTATLSADSGYYINPSKLTAVLSDGTTVTLKTDNSFWDTYGVYSFTLPKDVVSINCDFGEIVTFDSNFDGKTDVRDLVNTKNYIAGYTKSIALSNADADNDKKISSSDLVSNMKQLLNK